MSTDTEQYLSERDQEARATAWEWASQGAPLIGNRHGAVFTSGYRTFVAPGCGKETA